MEFLTQLPGIRTLRERGLLFPVIVLMAVAGVLLQGALHRDPPPSPDSVAEGPPAPVPAVSFRANLEKTPLDYQSDYWQQVASNASGNLVLVGPARAPGVLIAPGLALTSLIAADEIGRIERQRQAETEQAAPAPGEEEAPQAPTEDVAPAPRGPTLVGVDVEHGVALFAVPGSTSPAFMVADGAALGPGAFVAAVSLARDGGTRITPGHLVSPAVGGREGADPFEVSIAFPSSTSVAAIVDLDGDLLGIAVETEDGIRVLSARAILAVVGRLSSGGICQPIVVADLDEAVPGLLGVAGGVLVERVIDAAFTTPPAIRPGDVLLRWNGHDIGAVEEFVGRYPEGEPGAMVAFRVLRNRRRISGQLRMPQADCRPPDEPAVHFGAIGLSVEWATSSGEPGAAGWAVLAVREGSVAAGAGLEASDLIVAVDGLALARATAHEPFTRFERRPRPMLLTVRRVGRVRLLAMVPNDE